MSLLFSVEARDLVSCFREDSLVFSPFCLRFLSAFSIRRINFVFLLAGAILPELL